MPPARCSTSTASTTPPTSLVDVGALGADFFACSPYKFLGPHCGVLAARPEVLEPLRPDKLLPARDEIPERFELGTLALRAPGRHAAAVDFLADLVPGEGSRRERLATSLTALEEHEDRLRDRLEVAARRASRASRSTPARPVVRRRCWRRSRATTRRTSGGTWRAGKSTRRPAPSTPTRPRTVSAWETRAGCGWGSRRTPTTPTSTGWSTVSRSSSPVPDADRSRCCRATSPGRGLFATVDLPTGTVVIRLDSGPTDGIRVDALGIGFPNHSCDPNVGWLDEPRWRRWPTCPPAASWSPTTR